MKLSIAVSEQKQSEDFLRLQAAMDKAIAEKRLSMIEARRRFD
jgi:hypothetical protein